MGVVKLIPIDGKGEGVILAETEDSTDAAGSYDLMSDLLRLVRKLPPKWTVVYEGSPPKYVFAYYDEEKVIRVAKCGSVYVGVKIHTYPVHPRWGVMVSERLEDIVSWILEKPSVVPLKLTRPPTPPAPPH